MKKTQIPPTYQEGAIGFQSININIFHSNPKEKSEKSEINFISTISGSVGKGREGKGREGRDWSGGIGGGKWQPSCGTNWQYLTRHVVTTPHNPHMHPTHAHETLPQGDPVWILFEVILVVACFLLCIILTLIKKRGRHVMFVMFVMFL